MTCTEQSQRFKNALDAIDRANGEDPVVEPAEGQSTPRALLYSQRMTSTLDDYAPEAPEIVKIAVRCQHFRRWTVPRDTFPAGRAGYHRWRTELARLQAEWAGATLREAGYPESGVTRIQSLLRKERLREDAEVQLVEDTACLVFLRHYLGEFAERHPRGKVIDILRKTWKKMSARGQAAAHRLELSPEVAEWVAAALSDSTAAQPDRITTRESQRATA